MAWGSAYELALARLDVPGSLATDVADAVLGYAFDRFVMPTRLIRNARRALGRSGLFALYASLAAATAASRRLGQRRSRGRSAIPALSSPA